MWEQLKTKQLGGYKFRREHIIDEYIVDFYCPSEKIIVELDGEVHNNFINNEYDFKRTKELNTLGYDVLRFENNNVFENLDMVLEAIKIKFKR